MFPKAPALIVAILLSPVAAAAQLIGPTPGATSTVEIGGIAPRLHAGQKIWVTVAGGRVIAGVARSKSVLELQDGVATPADIRKIEVVDPVKDGILKGAVTGSLLLGLPVLGHHLGAEPGTELYGIVPLAFGEGAGIGALVGWVMDALHENRHTVYDAAGRSGRASGGPALRLSIDAGFGGRSTGRRAAVGVTIPFGGY